jgi:hypothetical protein
MGAKAIGDGAQAVGSGVKSGAQAVGHGVKAAGEAVGHGVLATGKTKRLINSTNKLPGEAIKNTTSDIASAGKDSILDVVNTGKAGVKVQTS